VSQLIDALLFRNDLITMHPTLPYRTRLTVDPPMAKAIIKINYSRFLVLFSLIPLYMSFLYACDANIYAMIAIAIGNMLINLGQSFEKKTVNPVLNVSASDSFSEELHKKRISIDVEKRQFKDRDQFLVSFRDETGEYHVASAVTEVEAIQKLTKKIAKITKYQKDILI